MKTIIVSISRLPINSKNMPRLYSSMLVDEFGPLPKHNSFRLRIGEHMSKYDIGKECSVVVFDKKSREVNAVLFLSSIIVGWAYRVTITKEFYDSPGAGIILNTLLPMITTLVRQDGWTSVSKQQTGVEFAASMMDGSPFVFDANLQLVPIALVTRRRDVMDKIRSKKPTCDEEARKYKIFMLLASFW